jgi:hypothetical protein
MLCVYQITPDQIDERAQGTPLAWIISKTDPEPKGVVYVRGASFVEDDVNVEKALEREKPITLTKPFYASGTVKLMRKSSSMPTLASAVDLLSGKTGKAATPKSRKRTASEAEDDDDQAANAVADGKDDTPLTSASSSQDEKEEDDEVDIFMPIPIADTFRIAVFGATGTGKSKWTADNPMRAYSMLHPENKICVWTYFDHDPAFDHIKTVEYKDIDDSIVETPPKTSEFENTLMIFDDIEALPKSVRDVMVKFRDQCLACGRKLGISTISIMHEIHAGHLTKTSITECDEIVIFSQGNGNIKPVKKLLLEKFGLSYRNTMSVIDSPTRWVLVKKSYPKVIMTPREIRAV